MRSFTTTSLLRVFAFGLVLTLASPLFAGPDALHAGTATTLPVAEAGGGWIHSLLNRQPATSAGSFDRQTVWTLLLTALAAIAVVRVAEHRHRPGQDR